MARISPAWHHHNPYVARIEGISAEEFLELELIAFYTRTSYYILNDQ